MEFVIIGELENTYKDIKSIIVSMGGNIISMLNSKTAAVISNEEEVMKEDNDMKFQIYQAKMLGIQVVTENFLEAVKNADPFVVIREMNIAKWSCNDVSYSK